MRRASLAAALSLLATACAPPAATESGAAAGVAPAAGRRAIVVSFDALNERRMLETVDPELVPAFRALFAEGACFDGARPAFPSVTSPGHASIWTGAYGNVNGVAANWQPVLPRPEHTLLEGISGYSNEALRAEPIWLAAVEAGLEVYGHHVTQAPGAPGYRPVDGPEPRLDSLRRVAQALLARPNAFVVNGYNRQLSEPVVLTEHVAPPRPATAWRNLERLGRTVAPREIAWPVGGDTLYGLLHGAERYDRVLVARERDASRGVVAVAAPVERDPVAGRELARHFSDVLEIPVEGGRAWLRARLFDLSPDGSRYLLFIPELRIVEGNTPEVAAAYDAAVQGWYGNSATWLLSDGALGAPLWRGGDGTAEDRWLETVELMARQFMRGAEWGWKERRPTLMLDYYPGIDEVDHALLGYVTPSVPGHDAAVASRVRQARARAWGMADLRLAHLRRLATESGAALFVGGDHGMRPTWRTFRPNVALAEAGLLARDSAGRIDLSRTRALSPNGYWVTVNRAAWKGGIVPPAEERAVIEAAARALEAARDSAGRPVVTRIFRPTGHDTLGMGGPVGGDLYYELAEGTYMSHDARSPVVVPGRPGGAHGFPSVAADMQTVFCAAGPGFPTRRLGPGRTIDLAPTVSEWLGIRPPAHAVGRSRLDELR
ncbi:MAG TPA: alkaline phosphatase family protein [Gemmatimonadales bacterium]